MNPQGEPGTNSVPRGKRIAIALGGFTAFAMLLMLLVPSILVAKGGGYKPREVGNIVCPDGRHRLRFSMRAEFPAWDVVSPNSVVQVTLIEGGSPVRGSGAEVHLSEDGDLGDFKVQWQSTQAVVSGIDQRNPSAAVAVGLTTACTRTVPLRGPAGDAGR